MSDHTLYVSVMTDHLLWHEQICDLILIIRINIRGKRFTRFQLLVDELFVTWMPGPISDVIHALSVTTPSRNGLISLLSLNMVSEGSVRYKLNSLLAWPQAIRWENCGFRLKNYIINSSMLRRNIRHFADDIFKFIFVKENVWIPIKILLKFVPMGPINNIPALVQIMTWCRPGNKPLSEPMIVRLPTHICVIQHQWVELLLERTSFIWKCFPLASILF